MLLSKSCVYGMKASLLLALDQNGEYIPIREVSQKLGISANYLTKIFQQLTDSGVMESQKGPKGGVRLSKPGSEINLYDIITAIDGNSLFTECALSLPGCGSAKTCPLHERWMISRDKLRNTLQETNLLGLVEKGWNMDLRLTEDGGFN